MRRPPRADGALYESGASYVEHQPIPDVFEKIDSGGRDAARRRMPIDLPTWSIANLNRALRMCSEFALTDSSSRTLVRYHDEEGAVHVSLAENSPETDRGNNHQTAYSDFRIVEGTYTVTYTLLPGSNGHASLVLWQQREGDRFVVLVGNSPIGTEQTSVEGADGSVVAVGETVFRSFTVSLLDEDKALFKSNANGFGSGYATCPGRRHARTVSASHSTRRPRTRPIRWNRAGESPNA